MTVQIRLTVSPEIDVVLEKLAKKLGKKKSTLARELMESKILELSLIRGDDK